MSKGRSCRETGRGCTCQVKRGMLGHSGESGPLRKPGRQAGHRWAGTVRVHVIGQSYTLNDNL